MFDHVGKETKKGRIAHFYEEIQVIERKLKRQWGLCDAYGSIIWLILSFRKSNFSGYRSEDVDDFIDEVKDSYDLLIEKNIEQRNDTLLRKLLG